MAGDSNFNLPGADAFGAFWSDFFGKMASAGVAPPQPSADMTERMRKAFFESFAKYADEFVECQTSWLSALASVRCVTGHPRGS